jgi:hypothetical protein
MDYTCDATDETNKYGVVKLDNPTKSIWKIMAVQGRNTDRHWSRGVLELRIEQTDEYNVWMIILKDAWKTNGHISWTGNIVASPFDIRFTAYKPLNTNVLELSALFQEWQGEWIY